MFKKKKVNWFFQRSFKFQFFVVRSWFHHHVYFNVGLLLSHPHLLIDNAESIECISCRLLTVDLVAFNLTITICMLMSIRQPMNCRVHWCRSRISSNESFSSKRVSTFLLRFFFNENCCLLLSISSCCSPSSLSNRLNWIFNWLEKATDSLHSTDLEIRTISNSLCSIRNRFERENSMKRQWQAEISSQIALTTNQKNHSFF